MPRILTACFLLLAVASSFLAADVNPALSSAIKDAGASDPAISARSIETLRDAGPEGLSAMLAAYDHAPDARLIPVIDAVAAQRGAVVSRLYWYTDFEQAKKAAKAENKPILYLRMMGKLTDEYSCANSRFFRTVLYANTNVSRLMREKFVPLWISERPVPIITIDYGDGRTLKRTVTGNSIHYVLDSDGRVIDAMPGLVGPNAFMSFLNPARGVALAKAGKDQILSRYLDRVDDQLLRGWYEDSTGGGGIAFINNGTGIQRADGKNPPAGLAMRRAVSKSAVEAPLVRQIAPQFPEWADQSINMADAATWDKIAARHFDDAALDASSIAVIKSQNPAAYETQAALDAVVNHFQHLIALDTVHNNYELRRKIVGWLRQSPGKIGVEELNQRVYSELFLTPRSDPWLGLAPEEYTALAGNGCFVSPRP